MSTNKKGHADISTSTVNNLPGVLNNLSYGLILHPIGAALGFIAVVFGLIGIGAASRFATIMMSLASALGALVTLVVFVFDMVMFNILRNRVRDAGGDANLVGPNSPIRKHNTR